MDSIFFTFLLLWKKKLSWFRQHRGFFQIALPERIQPHMIGKGWNTLYIRSERKTFGGPEHQSMRSNSNFCEDWWTVKWINQSEGPVWLEHLIANSTKGGSDLGPYFIGNKSLKPNSYVLVSMVSLEWIQQKQALVSRGIPEISMKQRLFILKM